MKEVSLLKLLKKRVKLSEEMEQIEFEIESLNYGDYCTSVMNKKDSCLRRLEKLKRKIKLALVKELEAL